MNFARIGISVVLGVILTAVVAFICAGWSTSPNYAMYRLNVPIKQDAADLAALQSPWKDGCIERGFPAQPDSMKMRLGWGVRERSYEGSLSRSNTFTKREGMSFHRLVVVDAGWPCFAFRGELWQVHDRRNGHSRESTLVAVETPTDEPPNWYTPRNRYMPVQPMFAGTLANVTFYSVVAFAAMFLVSLARNAVCRRRGVCVGCGYAVNDAAVCSECGRPTGVSIPDGTADETFPT